MKKTFDASWKNWIKTNVDAGQCRDGIFKILLDEGYSYKAIKKEMAYEPSVSKDELVNPFDAVKQQAARQNISNYGAPINRSALFIPNAEKLSSDKLELYTLENFLNARECEKIVALVKSQLRPSGLSSYEQDQCFRTSRTCDLGEIKNKFMADIDDRICRIIGIDRSYSEVIQGQYYEVGQEFKAHTDYFEENEMESYGANMGQRTYTIMIYLNDVEEGGETDFLRVGAKFKPRCGMAVIWSSLNDDGSTNVDSMHQAMPVMKGYKAVITKWFRSYSRLTPAPAMFTKDANEYIPNYTKEGFYKSRLPEPLFQEIVEFYQTNKASLAAEDVPGDFIFNKKKKNKVSSSLVQLSDGLSADIHDAMKPLMESWCGKTLDPTYVYGIRVYHDQAVLKTHRDRLETHIISAIINVDQEVKKDWPLIIEDNYYRTHRVLLKPGEMVFYEGGRLTHGRPEAFSGKSFANIFCHFKPVDYVPKKFA